MEELGKRTLSVFTTSIFLFSAVSKASVPSGQAGSKGISALEMIRDVQLETLSREQKESYKSHYDELLRIASMGSQGMKTRWKALMLAAAIQPELAEKDIAAFSRHEEWFMRNASLMALQKVNPLQAERVAKEIIGDKALVVRSAAVDILATSSSRPDRSLLWTELNQNYNFKGAQSLWIRPQIMQILNRNPRDAEMKLFGRALFDRDSQVREAARLAMEKITKLQQSHRPSSLKSWQEFAKREGMLR